MWYILLWCYCCGSQFYLTVLSVVVTLKKLVMNIIWMIRPKVANVEDMNKAENCIVRLKYHFKGKPFLFFHPFLRVTIYPGYEIKVSRSSSLRSPFLHPLLKGLLLFSPTSHPCQAWGWKGGLQNRFSKWDKYLLHNTRYIWSQDEDWSTNMFSSRFDKAKIMKFSYLLRIIRTAAIQGG